MAFEDLNLLENHDLVKIKLLCMLYLSAAIGLYHCIGLMFTTIHLNFNKLFKKSFHVVLFGQFSPLSFIIMKYIFLRIFYCSSYFFTMCVYKWKLALNFVSLRLCFFYTAHCILFTMYNGKMCFSIYNIFSGYNVIICKPR